MPNLGEMIKNKREAAGLSQKKLGTACGLSDSEIMKIENGQRKTPSWKNLCKIAQALDFHPLNENDIETIQLFVDFVISRKGIDRNPEGGL